MKVMHKFLLFGVFAIIISAVVLTVLTFIYIGGAEDNRVLVEEALENGYDFYYEDMLVNPNPDTLYMYIGRVDHEEKVVTLTKKSTYEKSRNRNIIVPMFIIK